MQITLIRNIIYTVSIIVTAIALVVVFSCGERLGEQNSQKMMILSLYDEPDIQTLIKVRDALKQWQPSPGTKYRVLEIVKETVERSVTARSENIRAESK